MKKAEILAPVGGGEQLIAAVRCGADAVYLGTRNFNARRNAENFDGSSLKEAVKYCRERGVKVYVTMNTVVMDGDLSALEAEADSIAASGADGVIIQDMAVLDIFTRRYPTIRRIASTQTAVHNTDGAKFLQDIGFDCVVLARELSLKEMEKICSAIDISAEAFIHGAHCMSLSGACYLSSMIGGRSGNHGVCAQPCRLDFHAGGREYALSLKDMSLISHIREMTDAGIDSFKIEGRMKRPEYVAAAVTACRSALEGRSYDAEQLRSVFSRSGFTDGYLTGKRDISMFGYRRKEDVTGAASVLGELKNLYKNENPLVPIDMNFTMAADKPPVLTVSDGTNTVLAEGAVPQKAINRPTDAAAAEKNLIKTGGTCYFAVNFESDITPGLMLPASELNALRREAIEKLSAVRSAVSPHEKREYTRADIPPHHADKTELWARFQKPSQIPGTDAIDRIILPARVLSESIISKYGDRLTAELPAVLFPEDEDEFEEKLLGLKELGLSSVITDNIYGIKLAKRLGLTIYGGPGLNMINSPSAEFYEKEGLAAVTISFELPMSRIESIGGSIKRGIISYGRLPLMRFRACPAKSASGCGKCGGSPVLTDRYNVEFPMMCDSRKYSTLLNSVPLHIAEKPLRNLDYQILYFTLEPVDECESILEDYIAGRKTALPHTGGLYYRKLL